MRILVCGGRDYRNRDQVFKTLDSIHRQRVITSIVEGGAPGADELAAEWACKNGIDLAECQANWKVHGNYAGPKRNKFMATLGIDGGVAFGGNKGTQGMIDILKSQGVKVMEVDRQFTILEDEE